MSLTVLSVAYPLAAVSADAAGGAEQVLATLDRALVASGCRSVVVAPASSRVSGLLAPIPDPPARLDEQAKADAQGHVRDAIAAALARWPVDVVHLHGIDFAAYLPPPGRPVLATLHLPLSWYPAEALSPARPDTWVHCVSDAQASEGPRTAAMLPPIPNGIDLDAFAGRHARRRFALTLGRICPEKGVHLALDAARLAGTPLVVAGEVFGYEAHTRYFSDEVRPRLGGDCRFVGPVGFARKRRLLAGARCVLIPSLAAETSSLVAREAAASGTPVVAYKNGALRDAVEEGRSGFLVDDVPGMAQAIGATAALGRDACRAVARERFGQDRMIAAYLDLYRRLAAGGASRADGP